MMARAASKAAPRWAEATPTHTADSPMSERPGAMRGDGTQDAVARRFLLQNPLAGRQRERRIGLVFQVAHPVAVVVISNTSVERHLRAGGGIVQFRRPATTMSMGCRLEKIECEWRICNLRCTFSSPRHRRQEGDVVAVVQRMIP